MRIALLLALSGSLLSATLYSQDPQSPDVACAQQASGYDSKLLSTPPPQLPEDLKQVELTYFEPGCEGECPVFRLSIRFGEIRYEGKKYVKVKGLQKTSLSAADFQRLLGAWTDGKFFAMHDDYCDFKCGKDEVTTLDLRESSTTLGQPAGSKTVRECSVDRPTSAHPPDAYFVLQRKLRKIAKDRGWL
jgi:hypothetical protein